jgi:predicted dehydrogenase
LPAIASNERFSFIGVAIADSEEWAFAADETVSEREKAKAENIKNTYGGKIFDGYKKLIESDEINAVYIPLPPSLHYAWAKQAIKFKKHVLLEKPFTCSLNDTEDLIKSAAENSIALHENYAFLYHKQIEKIMNIIESGRIGEIRHIRAAFGFPYRGEKDFRYNKELGGGALLDCGGYPIKIISTILGEDTIVTAASLCRAKGHDVDVFGSVTMENKEHLTGHAVFGMDNSYKCELEIWGSEGALSAPRIFTPPSDFKPLIYISDKEKITIEVESDDQFNNSANVFYSCIIDDGKRSDNYNKIKRQGGLIERVRLICKDY